MAELALRAGDRDAALAHALAAWQRRPSPALSRAIFALSAGQGSEESSLSRLDWSERASAAAHDRLSLLDTLLSDGAVQARKRLAIVACWSDDPRVDEWCVTSLERLPLRGISARGEYWVFHFERLSEIRDSSLMERIEALPERWRRDHPPELARWLSGQLARRMLALRERFQDRKDHPEALALEALISSIRPHRPRTVDLSALLAAVHRDPDDNGARMVYADALMERGDPRGDFIALQIRGDVERQAEAAALLERCGRAWLGPLARVIRSDFLFERGFLSRCAIKTSHPDQVRDLADHPDWSTLSALTGSCLLGLRRDLRGLRDLTVSMPFAVDRERLESPWEELLASHPRPLQRLAYTPTECPSQREIELLARCEALPQLKVLALHRGALRLLSSIGSGPVTERLHTLHLRLSLPREDFREELVAVCALAPVPRLEVTLTHAPHKHETTLSLTRGLHGYETLDAVLGPHGPTISWSRRLADELLELLAALTLPLSVARITLRRHAHDEIRALLCAGLRALGVERIDVAR